MMDGGTLAYGPVSTLAECLQHIAGCTECKGHWPAVPGMLAMTRRPDGHVDFEVSAAEGGGGPAAAIRLLPSEYFPDSREESQDSREEPETRLWTERSKFFSSEMLATSKTDVISEWIKANMAAFGNPGDEVRSENGVQVTIRHFDEQP